MVLRAVGMPVAPVQIYHRPAYTAAIAKGLSVTELGAKQKAAADEVRELWTFLDAGAPQPQPRKPKAKKKPAKKGGARAMSKKPPEDDRDGILTKLMSLGRGRSALPPPTEPRRRADLCSA